MNRFALLAGCATAIVACDDNSWNDKLDGFESNVNTETVTNNSYTLSGDDYKTISKLLLATAETDDEKAAAKAIAANMYFDKNSVYPAQVAVPMLFTQTSNPYYFAATGSTLDVTYDEASSVPAEIAQISGAEKYTVTTDDYKTVWESDENFINGFAPIKPASAAIPAILKNALPDAADGDYAIITYNEANTNPIFSAVGGDEPVVYINETFADGLGDFTIDNVKLPEGSTYVWKHDTYGGQSYMKASGYVNKASRDSEGWLLSPEIKLGENANATLSFEQAWKNFKSLDNAKEEATVQIRVKGGAWTKLSPETLPENKTYDFFPTGDIDLSAYNGKTIQIGFCYISTTESAGTWELRNVLLQNGTASRSRAAVVEVPTETKNAVYNYNGSKWEVATGVEILNPADYTAMGMSNNKLYDPDIYLPVYLKNKLPYAQDGAMVYVVYNGSTTDLFVLTGSVWKLNNNGLETVTGRYTKKSDAWEFTKYLGKAIYSVFKEAEIILDRSYMFVSGENCANPIDKNSSYGYLGISSVSINDGQIVMSNDTQAFTFATRHTVDDVVYVAADGYFFIIDSNGRFLYRKGTYGSFNVSDKPELTDGKAAAGYLWTANPNADGTWSVSCNLGEGNVRNVYFSSKYNNFAVYADATESDFLPTLFILE